MDTRSIVIACMNNVAAKQDTSLPPLIDALPLHDSGLDSLCMAIIVARLEDELEVDPFSVEEEFDFPVTVGEFVTLYERAVANASR
jgi:acyl carrier protein